MMQQPSDDRPAGGAAGRDRVRRVRHDDRAVQPAAGAGVLDVAAAQVAVCLITWAGVRLDRPGSRAPLGPLAWAATVTVIAVHLVGIVVAGPGSLVRCLGFAGPLPGLAGLADGGQRWCTGPAVGSDRPRPGSRGAADGARAAGLAHPIAATTGGGGGHRLGRGVVARSVDRRAVHRRPGPALRPGGAVLDAGRADRVAAGAAGLRRLADVVGRAARRDPPRSRRRRGAGAEPVRNSAGSSSP